jgi:hypothetical protein
LEKINPKTKQPQAIVSSMRKKLKEKKSWSTRWPVSEYLVITLESEPDLSKMTMCPSPFSAAVTEYLRLAYGSAGWKV